MLFDAATAAHVDQATIFEVLSSSTGDGVLVSGGEAEVAVAGATTGVVVAVEARTNQPCIVGIVVAAAAIASLTALRLVVDGDSAPGTTGEGLGKAVVIHASGEDRSRASNSALADARTLRLDLAVVVALVGAVVAQIAVALAAAAIVVELTFDSVVAAVADFEVQMAARGITGGTDGPKGLATFHPLTRRDVDHIHVGIDGVVGVFIMVDADVVAVITTTDVLVVVVLFHGRDATISHSNDRLTAVASHVEVPALVTGVGRRLVGFAAVEGQVVLLADPRQTQRVEVCRFGQTLADVSFGAAVALRSTANQEEQDGEDRRQRVGECRFHGILNCEGSVR